MFTGFGDPARTRTEAAPGRRPNAERLRSTGAGRTNVTCLMCDRHRCDGRSGSSSRLALLDVRPPPRERVRARRRGNRSLQRAPCLGYPAASRPGSGAARAPRSQSARPADAFSRMLASERVDGVSSPRQKQAVPASAPPRCRASPARRPCGARARRRRADAQHRHASRAANIRQQPKRPPRRLTRSESPGRLIRSRTSPRPKPSWLGEPRSRNAGRATSPLRPRWRPPRARMSPSASRRDLGLGQVPRDHWARMPAGVYTSTHVARYCPRWHGDGSSIGVGAMGSSRPHDRADRATAASSPPARVRIAGARQPVPRRRSRGARPARSASRWRRSGATDDYDRAAARYYSAARIWSTSCARSEPLRDRPMSSRIRRRGRGASGARLGGVGRIGGRPVRRCKPASSAVQRAAWDPRRRLHRP